MESLKNKLNQHPEIKALLLFIVGAVITIFLTNNFFSVCAPFLIAYVVTRILRPATCWLKKHLKMPNIINTTICILLLSGVIGSVVWLAGYYIVDGIEYIIESLSNQETLDSIIIFAQDTGAKMENLIEFLNIEVSSEDLTGVVTDFAKTAITTLSNVSLNVVMSVPSLIMSFIIGIVSAFYMLNDYDRLATFINNQLSPTTKKIVDVFNKQVLLSLIKMIFSYAVLSAVCFVEMMIGFMILGIKDAGFIALLIAILDVLPILGSGAILAPWGIIALIMGNPFVGIGMFVLWGVTIVVRQILEPRIVGSQIGLHPLITIMSLFLGLKLMGGLGLIMAPLYILVCKKLNEEGLISLYKETKKTEESKKKPDNKRK